MERRLAAILAADVAGYSRLMEGDEEATLVALHAHREIIDGLVAYHRGRVFGSAGDSVIAEFASPVEAVRCALSIQRKIEERNADVAEDRRMLFRIGVNLGDVMAEGDNLFGDGVNVAARLEQLAGPGEVCISGKVHDEVTGKTVPAFADAGEQQVKNIDRPVHVWRWPTDAAGAERHQPGKRRRMLGAIAAAAVVALVAAGVITERYWSAGEAVPSLPTGPKIAVIPFDDLGGGGDEYFTDGLTENITTELSRFSNLFVIATHSARQFKGRPVDCGEIRDELGADYVLSGAVQRSADHLRVTTRLLDTGDCTYLWSEEYDRTLTAVNVFAMQDEIAALVVGSIGSSEAPLWNSKVQRELRQRRTDSLEAYECVLLSYWLYETFSAEVHKRARDCLERAVEIDPGYALAWARLAAMYIEEKKYGWNAGPEPLKRALAAARKAIELDPQNQDAFHKLAMIRYMTEADFASFYSAADQAIAINPNAASIIADLGTWMAYSGRWERGKALIRRAMVLNPRHQRWYHFSFFLDHYRKGEYREALTLVLKMDLPENYMVQAALASTYAQLGEMERAKAALDHVLEIRPNYAEDPRTPFRVRRMPDDLVESIMDGLSKAGLDVPPADQ